MQQLQVLQITSIESAQLIMPLVTETAKRHELAVEIVEPVSFSAPFCGNEYFAQEIRMFPGSESTSESTTKRVEKFLLEVQTIVEQELADGYVDSY